MNRALGVEMDVSLKVLMHCPKQEWVSLEVVSVMSALYTRFFVRHFPWSGQLSFLLFKQLQSP